MWWRRVAYSPSSHIRQTNQKETVRHKTNEDSHKESIKQWCDYSIENLGLPWLTPPTIHEDALMNHLPNLCEHEWVSGPGQGHCLQYRRHHRPCLWEKTINGIKTTSYQTTYINSSLPPNTPRASLNLLYWDTFKIRFALVSTSGSESDNNRWRAVTQRRAERRVSFEASANNWAMVCY